MTDEDAAIPLPTATRPKLLPCVQISIQAPPNLTPEPDDAASPGGGALPDPAAGWRLLLDAGINDWGGARTVTQLVCFGALQKQVRRLSFPPCAVVSGLGGAPTACRHLASHP